VSGELVVTPELAYGSTGKSGAHGFTARQLARIDEALTLSSRESGLTFSVYVGELAAPTRDTANALFSELAAKATAPLLVAVSPGQRVLQIVTGRESAARIPNKSCALAALSMRASFSAGDLTGGIVTGLRSPSVSLRTLRLGYEQRVASSTSPLLGGSGGLIGRAGAKRAHDVGPSFADEPAQGGR
jgi:hypothetical protein